MTPMSPVSFRLPRADMVGPDPEPLGVRAEILIARLASPAAVASRP
ncbi:MAG TPA: hypothetical protein VF066_01245 [Thermoleophilaceae bacterium]